MIIKHGLGYQQVFRSPSVFMLKDAKLHQCRCQDERNKDAMSKSDVERGTLVEWGFPRNLSLRALSGIFGLLIIIKLTRFQSESVSLRTK